MLVLPALLTALSAYTVAAAPQQIPLGATRSLSSLVSPHLPSALQSSLARTLAGLPVEHLYQLEQHVFALSDKRRVQLMVGDGETVELTEGEKALLTLEGVKFVDVTNDVESAVGMYSKTDYPSKLKHTAKDLDKLFKHISIDDMKTFITKFSSFFTRYYRSETGRESQQWLLSHLQSLHKTLNPSANITLREFKHSTWDQRTIIVHWAPPASNLSSHDAPVVILGAHQDSTNRLPFLRAPGADDDGSGTTALVQIFTTLLKSKWEPSEHLELAAFSAEEGGLLGSGEVAREYVKEGRNVKAMWHMDVVAYVKPGTEPVIGLITDNSTPELVDYMKLLIDEYAEIPYAETQTHYPASDYGSFYKVGYPAACTAEGKFEDSNPNMHSTADIVDRPDGAYSFEHIKQFVRFGTGYAVELAGFKAV
ncbi:hypothetical protein JCM8547_000278 [Rhodosporidiobolus lusitaniae]